MKIRHWKLIPVYLQSLLFADNIALVTDTPEKLQTLVKIWHEKLKDKSMQVNVSKSKILHITKDKEPEITRIIIDGNELEEVEEYKYLGTIFTRNGKINNEIKHRVKQATNIYYQLNKTVIGKKEVTEKTKLQIYSSIYKPTLLYGAESWPVTQKVEQQVTAAEMKFLRRVAYKTKRDLVRNTKIREDLKMKPILEDIETKQLKWYGHVKRMSKERIPRKCFEARMEGHRARGRPRTSWIENIISAGRKRNKTLIDMNKLVANRKEWKKFTESHPTP